MERAVDAERLSENVPATKNGRPVGMPGRPLQTWQLRAARTEFVTVSWLSL